MFDLDDPLEQLLPVAIAYRKRAIPLVLTLVTVLLDVWILAFGSQVVKSGQRRLVARNDSRDYSIFRIGRNMAESLLTNGSPLQISLVFYS